MIRKLIIALVSVAAAVVLVGVALTGAYVQRYYYCRLDEVDAIVRDLPRHEATSPEVVAGVMAKVVQDPPE